MTPSSRLLLGIGGLAAAAYGAVAARRPGSRRLRRRAIWLVGRGASLHDAVLAPLDRGRAWSCRRAAGAAAAPWRGCVVLGSVTLLAVPVLGRFGARPTTRRCSTGTTPSAWLVLAALTWSRCVARRRAVAADDAEE